MATDTKDLIKVEEELKKPRYLQWKGNGTPKQRAFLSNWLTPASETYGNAYKSALQAGYRPGYAINILNESPKWLLSFTDRLDFTVEHIKAGIQGLALAAPNSRSPDDTRLKAYELLAKNAGMIDKQGGINFTVVQPILGGQSVKRKTVEAEVKVRDGTRTEELIPED